MRCKHGAAVRAMSVRRSALPPRDRARARPAPGLYRDTSPQKALRACFNDTPFADDKDGTPRCCCAHPRSAAGCTPHALSRPERPGRHSLNESQKIRKYVVRPSCHQNRRVLQRRPLPSHGKPMVPCPSSSPPWSPPAAAEAGVAQPAV